MRQVQAKLLVVTSSSPKVVLHLRACSHAPPPVAASLLAASASPVAATSPAAQLAAPLSNLSLGLGAGAGAGVGAGAGLCLSDEDEEDGEGDEGGEYPRESPSAVLYDPTYEPEEEEAAGTRKRQRPEQRSEPPQAAHMHHMYTHTAEGRSGAWQTFSPGSRARARTRIVHAQQSRQPPSHPQTDVNMCVCRRPIAIRWSSLAQRRRPGC